MTHISSSGIFIYVLGYLGYFLLAKLRNKMWNQFSFVPVSFVKLNKTYYLDGRLFGGVVLPSVTVLC